MKPTRHVAAMLNEGPDTGGRLPSLTTCRQEVSHKPILHSRNYAAMIYLSYNKDDIFPVTSTIFSISITQGMDLYQD